MLVHDWPLVYQDDGLIRLSAFIRWYIAGVFSKERRLGFFWGWVLQNQYRRSLKIFHDYNFLPEIAIPALADRFVCSRCGNRETVSQPRYRVEDIALGSSGAQGLIMPLNAQRKDSRYFMQAAIFLNVICVRLGKYCVN